MSGGLSVKGWAHGLRSPWRALGGLWRMWVVTIKSFENVQNGKKKSIAKMCVLLVGDFY